MGKAILRGNDIVCNSVNCDGVVIAIWRGTNNEYYCVSWVGLGRAIKRGNVT